MKIFNLSSLLRVFCLLFTASHIHAQSGTLYTGFNGSGLVAQDNGEIEKIEATSVMPDGRIVVGGSVIIGDTIKYYVNRFLPDGSQDRTFNNGSPKIFSTNSNSLNIIYGITTDPDGNIYMTGTTGNDSTKMCIISLDASGAENTRFDDRLLFSSVDAYGRSIMYFSPDESLIVAGYSSHPSGKAVVVKMDLGGNFIENFGTGGIAEEQMPLGKISAMDISPIDSSIYIAGQQYNGGASRATILKFFKTGDFDNTFGIVSILPTSHQHSSVYAIKVLSDGNIIVGGNTIQNSKDDLYIFKLNQNGNIDGSFAENGQFLLDKGDIERINALTINRDGSIFASGYYGSVGRIIGTTIYLDPEGKTINSFGTNGIFDLQEAVFYTSSISYYDGTLLLAGQYNTSMTTTDILMAKLNLSTPIIFEILGKTIVSAKTENTYSIVPQLEGYTYEWEYSSDDIYYLGLRNKKDMTLYFGRNTSSGYLSCKVFDALSNWIAYPYVYVEVNYNSTDAYLLTPPECELNQNYCNKTHISSFEIENTNIKSLNTGCGRAGYSDLTSSTFYDTLYSNDFYNFIIRCGGEKKDNNYAAAWIDFNNDGKISETYEFVGSGASQDSVIIINNIHIPKQAEPGSRRLRIRIRHTIPFEINEFCFKPEEEGETEDYLVKIDEYERIDLPNFITPNNDGRNDYFVIRGINKNLENELKIYDHIGVLVYSAKNYDNTWNGKNNNGQLLKPGTYYYIYEQQKTFSASQSESSKSVEKGFFEIRY